MENGPPKSTNSKKENYVITVDERKIKVCVCARACVCATCKVR